LKLIIWNKKIACRSSSCLHLAPDRQPHQPPPLWPLITILSRASTHLNPALINSSSGQMEGGERVVTCGCWLGAFDFAEKARVISAVPQHRLNAPVLPVMYTRLAFCWPPLHRCQDISPLKISLPFSGQIRTNFLKIYPDARRKIILRRQKLRFHEMILRHKLCVCTVVITLW